MAILTLADGTYFEGFVVNEVNPKPQDIAILFDNFSRLLNTGGALNG